ncbi:hypothetical protein [Clostridium sp. AM49-4BH]|jgi:hypothetical protein|nr:hypothetical protein [Clostridium sp. AM49-4BH]
MNGHKRKISKTIICFRKQIKHINSQNNIAFLRKKPYNINKLMNKGVQQ